MTDTIDKRVVEMAFENDKFEKGTTQTLSSIDKLKRALNFKDQEKSFDGISSAAGKVNLGSIGDSLSNISSKFSALGIVGVTALVNLTNAAIAAGTRMIKALTIDPISTGLNEYETKLNSVQTILANTQKEGTNLATVSAALQQLNDYSDKTIYNFQQMTRNVGTFTAAGVSLDTSVQAIKGIANLAAISGSNADQASTAMYQLSQAISTGTVRLMDWNSVVNAGMGGQVFQDAIKDTARVHGVAIDQIIKDEGSFRASLEKNWLTSEILTETLAKFTGDLNADQLRTMGYTEEQIQSIIKMGQTANDAATKVKTFTQLFDTLKEAAQSGWAQTWELLIGDFEEAKSFLTDLNNWFGGILATSAAARNNLIKGWKDLGGRTELIKAFQNALNSIVLVINPIKEGFRQIFPPATAEQLMALTKGISAFTEKLIIGAEAAAKVKRIFAGVFAFVDIVKMGVFALVKQLALLVGSFSDTGAGLVDLIANFGDWLVKLRDALKGADTFNTIFANILKPIKPLIDGVIGFFTALIHGFSSSEKLTKSNSLANFLAELGEKFKAFGKLGEILSKVFGILSRLADKLGPIVMKIASKLGDVINHMLDAVTRGLDNLDVNKVLDTLNKGLFGGILISINSFINTSKKVVGGGLFASILLGIKNFIDNGGDMLKGVTGILNGVKNSLEAYQKSLKANTLLKIAGAIALLATAIIALTLVDQTKLVNATAVIGAMFVGLTTTLDIFDKTTSGGTKLIAMTASLLGISAALLIMAGTIVILSKLDPKEATQGVLAVGAVLGLLLLFQKSAAGAVGLTGLSIGLDAVAVSMLVLSVALNKLGGSDTEALVKGLFAMGAALGIIAVGMNAMTASMVGSASLLVAAAAIAVLSVSLKALGELSLEQVGIALLALAGIFTVLGVAGALLTPVVPTIALVAVSLLALGAAVAAFGIGVGAVGVGIGVLATGIFTLSGVTAVGIAAISALVVALAGLLPLLATQAVKAIAAFVDELVKSAPKMATAAAKIGLAMLQGFVPIIPQLIDTVLNLIVQLLAAIEKNLPTIIKSGSNILLSFLKGMRDNIGQVVTVSIDVVNNYLNAVASRMPEIVKSGWNLIISWIDGVAASAEENIPRLMTSVRGLGLAIIKGILNGLIDGHAEAKAGIAQIGQILIDGFKEHLGIHSPSDVFIQLAQFIIDGLTQGIIRFAFQPVAEIVKMGVKLVDAAKSKYNDMVTAGQNLVTGFANGIKNYIGNAISKARDLATSVLNVIHSVLDEHSPSQATFNSGKNVSIGFANGITKFASLVLKATQNMGNDTVSSFSDIVSRISDALNSDKDFNPVISPVLDLSNVQKNSAQIADMLAQKSINVSSAASNASWISGTKQTNQAPIADNAAQTKGNQQYITFNQTNNSPKELDRIQIYRQTKNQLLQAKGLIGA